MTREEAIKRLQNGAPYIEIYNKEWDEALDMAIKALEQKEKIGHWIVHPKDIFANLVCDKCLSNAPYNYPTNYCPNCGARMEVENEQQIQRGKSL